ncbi:hypothetical protein AO262_33530 [Pseudomonas fluorescens ABAC62]|nr:hypothetical protein AO262_33530 [Pseudomonas fluorescens ABAC62]
MRVIGLLQSRISCGCGQDFEGLLPIYRLQYPITQAAQVFAEHEHNGFIVLDDQYDILCIFTHGKPMSSQLLQVRPWGHAEVASG